ncbi:unnamed protein product [Bursaphelenchus okinawaensis]|uniref:Uncharacterized protein n=1 Tax=Bursaphelenchus okinawaensis TaxID=465554 RepID=A0A811LN47_9BILA|nr:unnamed protein product [Bursaphelenchus okinawaensis]CAG9127198.1 unnamed protein product [Bursaphelenchus okinawaensis]
MWSGLMLALAIASVIVIDALPSRLNGIVKEDLTEPQKDQFVYLSSPEVLDYAERFSEPDIRNEKRSVAISRLNFRPGKRSIMPGNLQPVDMFQPTMRLNKRYVLARTGFRPARK